MIKTLKKFRGAISIAVVLLAIFFIVSGITTQETVTATHPDDQDTTATTTLSHTPDYFRALSLEAQAVHIYDLKTQQDIFTYNENTPLPLASLTKLMTALVAREYAPNDNLVVTITQTTNNELLPQEQWNIRNLIDVTLVSSSNDGAYALATAVAPFITTGGSRNTFITAMNQLASRIGLEHTSFLTATGLDINGETQPSALGSARDITRLFSYILTRYPSLLAATQNASITRTSLSNREYRVENTNTIVNTIPWLIGSKTGFTDQAGGNLVVAFDVGPSHPVVIAVLGSTVEGRFTDMQQLITATLAYFNHGV